MSAVNFYDLIARTFWPVHEDVRAWGHSEYWLKGGRGSGKSSYIALEIVLGLLRDPLANAIVYRRVGNTLKDSVYAQVLWAVEALGVSDSFRAYRSPLEVVYRPTGQRIIFRGADDPMKSKSFKLERGYVRFLWFEELAEFMGMDDVRVIRQSAFRGVDRACTFFSYNPPRSAQSWVNREYLEHTDPAVRLVHHSTYLDMPEEWLREQFIQDAETLQRTNPRAWENEYLGEITGTGGQVFDNLQLRAISEEELGALDRYYNGLDFGFASDPDALTRWAYSPATRTLYAVREFVASHNSVDALTERVRDVAGREVVWADSEDARTIAELRRRGVNAVAVKKCPGSVKAGIKWLQDLAAIVVDPARTPVIAKEFAAYEYLPDRLGGFLPEVPDKDNHTIDSGRYALNQQIQQRIARTRGDL